MMLVMQILVALGMGVVIYAIFGMFISNNAKFPKKKEIQNQTLPVEDSNKEQKIQRLQSQIAHLESRLEQSKVASVGEQIGLMTVKDKEAEFSVELKRREDWVEKAEAELAKIKAENLDLNNKFITKENELQEEFAKNVDLTRQMREIKSALETKEVACRLKEDQLQAQKHQSESQLKSIGEYLATIAEFNRKEKINEWVPKLEFNQLSVVYTKLEKNLEASQERLKSFAVEIAHLRQLIDKKDSLVEEIKIIEEDGEKKTEEAGE
jgi:chromosome segregation ATPase